MNLHVENMALHPWMLDGFEVYLAVIFQLPIILIEH